MSVPPNIITQNLWPPIPDRRFDWCAHFDGHEEWLCGFGPTKQAAIDDLLELYEGMEVIGADNLPESSFSPALKDQS